MVVIWGLFLIYKGFKVSGHKGFWEQGRGAG